MKISWKEFEETYSQFEHETRNRVFNNVTCCAVPSNHLSYSMDFLEWSKPSQKVWMASSAFCPPLRNLF